MFYKKKLENIDALYAEKRALKQQLSMLQNDDAQVSKKNKKSSKALGQKMMEAAMGKSKFASIAMQVVPMLLPSLTGKVLQYGTKKLIIRVAKEVGFGYLKWKVLEIGYGFITDKIKKRKEAQ